jgi:zinc transport system substrate-binding protein
MKTRIGTGALACGLVLATAACGDNDDGPGAADDRLRVVASFYPLFEAVREVGGERVQVSNLTPAGAEPHDLELNPDQVEQIEKADVVVVLGEGFQPAVERAAHQREGTTVVVLDHLDLAGTAREERAGDPHVWLDPVMTSQIADVIGEELAQADPDGQAAYTAAATSYGERLVDLDRRYRDGLATCDRRVMVTAHAAFGWLAARYDLEQEAVAGVDPAGEPSPTRLAELVHVVRDRGVTTVFTETLVSPEVAETLAREAGVDTAVLNPLEGLSRKQLDAGEDYVSVMDANLMVLRTALGCR